jgi:hypothetical protein
VIFRFASRPHKNFLKIIFLFFGYFGMILAFTRACTYIAVRPLPIVYRSGNVFRLPVTVAETLDFSNVWQAMVMTAGNDGG